MGDKKIPIPYIVILNRMENNCIDGYLELGVARRILTYIFRMPGGKINSILTEMQNLELIKLINPQTVQIVRRIDIFQ